MVERNIQIEDLYFRVMNKKNIVIYVLFVFFFLTFR